MQSYTPFQILTCNSLLSQALYLGWENNLPVTNRSDLHMVSLHADDGQADGRAPGSSPLWCIGPSCQPACASSAVIRCSGKATGSPCLGRFTGQLKPEQPDNQQPPELRNVCIWLGRSRIFVKMIVCCLYFEIFSSKCLKAICLLKKTAQIL